MRWQSLGAKPAFHLTGNVMQVATGWFDLEGVKEEIGWRQNSAGGRRAGKSACAVVFGVMAIQGYYIQ
jgi:hypothetical protein